MGKCAYTLVQVPLLFESSLVPLSAAKLVEIQSSSPSEEGVVGEKVKKS